MKNRTFQFKIFNGIIMLFLASLACAMPASTGSPSGLDQTQVALSVEQTSLAREKSTIAAREQVTATNPPPAATQAPTNTQEPSATNAPSLTPPPAQPTQPPATATLVPSQTAVPSPTAIDIEAKIRGANVLVFEDMASYYQRTPLVRQAVSEMNFSGGRVIQVGDALGNFKEQLINTTKWDLILVAAEYRSAVQGEFWKYVYDQVNRGVAVAIEVWYLDRHYSDIQPLFSKCGIQYHKNWTRGPKYRIEDYAIYWLQPDHPFFQPPQDPVTLANVNYLYWVPPLTEDGGDLIQLDSGGDAVILAGTQPNLKSQYGVLASCLNGTMIVQTYSSHDYKPTEVVKLWKNYMRYTLTNHFLQQK